ncbi:bifunctional endoribonuclease/protein kinase ire1 [Microbotryomycetes sp. JL221]|nr:bifunctional endoribonuclease/protein kinase ire1 [Microbotryomycetes sp. JL221]
MQTTPRRGHGAAQGQRSRLWWSLVAWLWLTTVWPAVAQVAQVSSRIEQVSPEATSVSTASHVADARGDGSRASAQPSSELGLAPAAPAPFRHRPTKRPDSHKLPEAVKHFRFNAPTSSTRRDDGDQSQDPKVEDLNLSPLVIAVTIDGHVHALKRDTGQWLWTLHDDGGAALSGVDPRDRLERLKAGDALGGHLVKAVSRRRAALRQQAAAAAAKARANGTAEVGLTIPEDLDDDDDFLDEEVYIVEPSGGGDIYLYASDGDGAEPKLQKLPLSMIDLVGQSPFSFPSLSSRIFVGRKDTKFVGVDIRNGRLVGVFGADAGWCEWDVQREASIKSEADYEDDISRRPEDLLYIARTDYHLNVFAKNSALPLQTLTYTTYTSSSLGSSLQSQWTKTPDNRYFQPMHDGALLCFMAGVPGVNWSIDFETPVVSLFDVAIYPDDGKGESAQPLLFEHPHPLLVEDELPFDFQQLQRLPETTYVGRVGKDVFALHRDNFPLVAFAPSSETKQIGASEDSDELDEVDQNNGSEGDGALVPVSGKKCRGLSCLTGRHRTIPTVPDTAIEPAPSRSGIEAPKTSIPRIEPTAVPNPSSPPFPNRSSVLARLSQPVKNFSNGEISPTLLLLFLAIIGYYYVRKSSAKQQPPSRRNQERIAVTEEGHKDDKALNGAQVSPKPDEKPAAEKSPRTKHNSAVLDADDTPAIVAPSAEHADTVRPRSASIASIQEPPPSAPSIKDLPPLPQPPTEADIDGESDGDDPVEKGNEGAPRKRGRRRRGKKNKHKNGLVPGALAGEPVLDQLAINGEVPDVSQANGSQQPLQASPKTESPDSDLKALALTAADVREEKESDDFDVPKVSGPLQVGGLSVSETILGYGSHGTVVLRGEFQGRAVAVKRLLRDFVTIATHEVNLLQESDDHPNVIRYFCKEQRDTFLYIALELCPASLFELIDQPSSFRELLSDFDPKRALKQIASGIRHLHNLKIVHRDIKPQNILVSTSTRGKGVRMLISDFGLCKKLDVDESSFQQTVNHAAGSFGYRAPEVLRGQVDPNDAINNSSGSASLTGSTASSTGSSNLATDPSLRLTRSIDIFSLGCIFYYVLTGGEHPFGGRYEREMNILQGRFSLESLDGLGEEALEVQHLISRMVASDPRERPTAEAVLLHPFFWNAQKRLLFICDASDRFEIMERDPPAPTLVTLESRSQEIVGDDWSKALDRTLLDNLGKYRKYDGKSVRDLLRVLRNKKHHYQDLPEAVRRNLGDLPGGFLSYFTTRFPNLLLHVYDTVEIHLRDEPMFASTFRITDDEHM